MAAAIVCCVKSQESAHVYTTSLVDEEGEGSEEKDSRERERTEKRQDEMQNVMMQLH